MMKNDMGQLFEAWANRAIENSQTEFEDADEYEEWIKSKYFLSKGVKVEWSKAYEIYAYKAMLASASKSSLQKTPVHHPDRPPQHERVDR